MILEEARKMLRLMREKALRVIISFMPRRPPPKAPGPGAETRLNN
jgi:hypothetical protein